MCHLCQTKPVYEFTNKRKVCKTCYIRWFEKKVFYTIRKFEMLNKGDIVGYVVPGTQGRTPKNIQKNIFTRGNFRFVVLEEVLKMVAEKARTELTTGKKFDKFAIPKTTDLIAYEIINKLINSDLGDLTYLRPSYGKIIKPLYLFLDKEVLIYAKLKKLSFKKAVEKRDEISGFINDLEKKHPEVKWSIVQGMLRRIVKYRNL